VRSPAETHAQLARFQAHWQEHGFGVWAVRQAATGEFVGRAGFLHTRLSDPAFMIETVGLLYAIVPEFWGRGYARAIATALVTLALDRLHLPEISGWTLITNARSQRVLAHAGLRYECRFTHWNLPHVFYRRCNHLPVF
jgi:RimJ/RimL family protein N-acetyltransferase